MQWWMSRSSMSSEQAAPARWNRSPSPVASTTTCASTARRPCLLSKIAPRTAPSCITGVAPQAWNRISAPASSTISCAAAFIASGSQVGDQVTMPWKAAVRCAHQAAVAASREPQASARRAGDGALRQAVQDSSAKPRITSAPGPVGHAVDPDHQPAGGKPAEVVVALQQHGPGAEAGGGDRGGGAGRAAAHHQHVAFGMDGDLARRLR